MRKSNISPIDISQPQAPPPSSVQDYLARKYASLGIDPPEPNGHPPGHIPASLTDERSDAAPTPSEGDQRSDFANKPCDERSNVANMPPDPAPAAPSPKAAPQNPHPASADNGAAPKPLTRDQRTALDLLERGKTVTDIMDTLGFDRRTFYDWREASPTFAAAVQRTRDERRGVLVDAVEDVQLAGLTLIDNYIRSDHASDSIRLRAVGLIFRYGNTENILPRRLVANLTGPDGLTPITKNPQGGPTAPAPCEQQSDLAPSEGEQQSDLANSSPEAGSHEPEPDSAPSPTESSNQEPVSATNTPISHTEETAESVRSVRFENAQSTTAPPSEQEADAAPTEIRTPNVSDGFPPSPERERRVPAEASAPSAPTNNAVSANTSDLHQTPSGSAGITPNPERERRDTIPPAPSQTAEGAIANNANSSGEPSDAAPAPREQRSDLAPPDGEQRSDLASPACDERSKVANLSPDPGSRIPDPVLPDPEAPPPPKPRKPETLLADAYLSATFLHKHEPRAAFETLLKHQLRAYAPATPQEELLTFRIAQKSWILRRLDTFERVIADSAVTKVRDKHPNAAPVACIAMTYLERKDTETTRFYERIANQRKDHEAALDRLEAKLQTLQHRREAREDRREARADRRQDREDRHRKPIQPTALPATPKALQRAAS